MYETRGAVGGLTGSACYYCFSSGAFFRRCPRQSGVRKRGASGISPNNPKTTSYQIKLLPVHKYASTYIRMAKFVSTSHPIGLHLFGRCYAPCLSICQLITRQGLLRLGDGGDAIANATQNGRCKRAFVVRACSSLAFIGVLRPCSKLPLRSTLQANNNNDPRDGKRRGVGSIQLPSELNVFGLFASLTRLRMSRGYIKVSFSALVRLYNIGRVLRYKELRQPSVRPCYFLKVRFSSKNRGE